MKIVSKSFGAPAFTAVRYVFMAFVLVAAASCGGDDENNGGSGGTGTEAVYARAVDLGLPSGLKWATCNVGATSPEEYGDYYAWGETETKGGYVESNSNWYGVSYSLLKSEGVIDIKGNLTPAYDVATVRWGGKWRMPTLAEIKELLKNCTWTWTTRNGVKGWLVTGKNGNSIFLPAAGCRLGTDLDYASSSGYYWSSTAYDYGDDSAYNLYFDSDYSDWYGNYRDYGQSVRPVSE